MKIYRQEKTWDAFLGDDGSMDTIIVIKANGHAQEIRFDCETASPYRDKKTGAMSARGFKELAEMAIDELDIEEWAEFWPRS